MLLKYIYVRVYPMFIGITFLTNFLHIFLSWNIFSICSKFKFVSLKIVFHHVKGGLSRFFFRSLLPLKPCMQEFPLGVSSDALTSWGVFVLLSSFMVCLFLIFYMSMFEIVLGQRISIICLGSLLWNASILSSWVCVNTHISLLYRKKFSAYALKIRIMWSLFIFLLVKI